MAAAKTSAHPDVIEQIPDPDSLRTWLAESIRRSDLLRSLLRVAIRKANYRSASQGTNPGPTEVDGRVHAQ
jgi:hypothetical protein